MLKTEDVRLLADENKSYTEIAEITGYSYNYIAVFCKKHKIRVSSKTTKHMAEIKKLLKEGYNTKEISEKIGLVPSRIRQLCKEHNVKLNKRRARKYGGEFITFCNNHTLEEIQQKYGINGVQAVHRLDIKHQYKHNGYTPQTYEIIQDLNDGIKQSVISRKYNVSRQWVSYVKLHLMEN